jgi:PKD repeat protein
MKFTRIAAAVAAFSLVTASAAFADQFTGQIDAALGVGGNALSYSLTGEGNTLACTARGVPVSGQGTIQKNDNQGPTFDAGQTLSITGVNLPTGITVASDGVQLPSNWRDSGGRSVNVAFTTTVADTVPDDVYTITLRATGSVDGQSASITDTYTVNVACTEEEAVNAPPVITSFTATATAACTVDAAVEWTDEDADDTHSVTFAWGDDSADTVVENAVSPTSRSHTYAEDGTYTLTATVSDGEDSDSDTAEFTTKLTPSAIMEPIKPEGGSSFKINQSIPVKITVSNCGGDVVEDLAPTVALSRISKDAVTGEETISDEATAAPTNGKEMLWNGEHYHYVLSTRNSQFNNGKALAEGTYRVSIRDDAFFAPASEVFSLRK